MSAIEAYELIMKVSPSNREYQLGTQARLRSLDDASDHEYAHLFAVHRTELLAPIAAECHREMEHGQATGSGTTLAQRILKIIQGANE